MQREAKLIEEKVKRLEEKLVSIAEGNSKGLLSDEVAKNQADKTQHEITVLKIEKSDYKIEEYDTEAVKNFTESFLINLDRFWMSLELPEKQELQKKMFPKGIICKNKKIRTAGLSSSFELIEALNTQDFNLVTHMFQNWNQIQSSLEQWNNLLHPTNASNLYSYYH